MTADRISSSVWSVLHRVQVARGVLTWWHPRFLSKRNKQLIINTATLTNNITMRVKLLLNNTKMMIIMMMILLVCWLVEDVLTKSWGSERRQNEQRDIDQLNIKYDNSHNSECPQNLLKTQTHFLPSAWPHSLFINPLFWQHFIINIINTLKIYSSLHSS